MMKMPKAKPMAAVSKDAQEQIFRKSCERMKMPKEVWRIDPQQPMAAVCKDAQEQIFWPAYDCVFQFDV